MVTEHWVFDSSYYWTECLWRQVNNERHSLVVRHSNYNSKHAGSNPADAIKIAGTVPRRGTGNFDNVIWRIAQYYSGNTGSIPVDINACSVEC